MDDLCLPVTQFFLTPSDFPNGVLELLDLPMINRIEFREPGPESSKLSRRQMGYGLCDLSDFYHNLSFSFLAWANGMDSSPDALAAS